MDSTAGGDNPPRNIDAEQALLGAILVNNEAHDRVSRFLMPEHFFDPVHAGIYEVAAKLIAAGKQATPITLRTFFESAEPITPHLTVPQYLGRLAANATTIINAAEYAKLIIDLARRRTLLERSQELSDRARDPAAAVAELTSSAICDLEQIRATVEHDGWQVPDTALTERSREHIPEMPLEGFGASLAQLIEDAAEAVGAPRDYVGLAVLTGGAGLIGARRLVEIWEGWKEPGILWAALIGDPSTNKSPAIDPIRDALVRAEAKKLDEFMPLEDAFATEVATAKASRKAWERIVEIAVQDQSPVPPMPKEAQDPKKPVRPRQWIANATLEKLARLLAEQPGGLINFSDELAGLFGSFDRYRGEGGDRAFYLELYGGRPYRLDRVKDGSIDIPYMAVSLLGTIQPDRLNRLVLSGDNDGLASRFLFAWPTPRQKMRPRASPRRELLYEAIEALSQIGFDIPLSLPVSPTGVDLFQGWWQGKMMRTRLPRRGS